MQITVVQTLRLAAAARGAYRTLRTISRKLATARAALAQLEREA
jgi:hypothetical protein